MGTECRIELFGGLRVTVGREVVARFPTQKAGLLLAYLALTPEKPRTRESLIALLWLELEPDAGRNNLSTLLSLLRRVLEPGDTPAGSVLQANRQTITLNSATVQTDVAEFDALLQRAARTSDVATRCRCWRQAAGLVRGELLPDCYEEWALQSRRLYAERYGQILRDRAALLLDLKRFEEAQADAARALEADGCDEAACQLRMRALAAMGRREAALQAYAGLEHALQSQLQTTPDATIRALQDRLRSHPETFLAPVNSAPAENKRESALHTAGAANAPAPVAMSAPSPEKATATTEVASVPPAPEPGHDAFAVAAPASFPEETGSYALRLPAPLTRFFGRERERAELESLLCASDTRLITLMGAGGAGKTRLALEVARQIAPRYAGRVWFIALADIPDPALIPLRLLTALQLPLPPADPLQAVIAALAVAPSLLILDNMEHLLPAGEAAEGETKSENPQATSAQALIRRLLEAIPHLTCLATSRQALHLEGEQEYALPPLTIPGRDEGVVLPSGWTPGMRDEKNSNSSLIPHPSSLLNCASIALYVDRAQKAKADFILTARNGEAVVELCRRLEGMPLAIEMAAAWIKTVPPARMLERLEHQLEMLVSRRRDLPARQQSLRATCEWSYALLSPQLQRAFRHLSVFRGGWTAEAAAAVWEEDKEIGRQGDKEKIRAGEEFLSTLNSQLSTPLHLLAELQARSLIGVVEAEGADADEQEPRYRMMEPLREFGMEKLVDAGESEQVGTLHARWFRKVAADAKRCHHGPDENRGLDLLKQEQGNLRVALAWYRQNNGREGLGFAADLWRFWELSGSLAEGRHWFGEMLALPSAQERTEERAHALYGTGVLSLLQADYAEAERWYREAQDIFKEWMNPRGQADALHGRGNVAFYEQQYERARECYERSLDMRIEAGDERGIAASCHSLGNLQMRLENYGCAREYLERALQIRHKRGEEFEFTQTRGALGQLACCQGQYETALSLFCEILQAFQRRGIVWLVALCLRDIAEVCWYQGQRRQVVCLIAASQALRTATGFPIPPAERKTHEEQQAELRAELGDQEYAQAWAQGYAMNAEQAVTHALQVANRNARPVSAGR